MFCILINKENTSSSKHLTLVKTTLFTSQSRETVVASLPSNPSRDVMAVIPIVIWLQPGNAVLDTRSRNWLPPDQLTGFM